MKPRTLSKLVWPMVVRWTTIRLPKSYDSFNRLLLSFVLAQRIHTIAFPPVIDSTVTGNTLGDTGRYQKRTGMVFNAQSSN